MELEKFTSPIDSYQPSALNDALYTVYGELSPNLHPKLKDEAEALVSTMLNRLRNIGWWRLQMLIEKSNLDAANEGLKKAKDKLEDIGKRPTAIISTLKEQHPEWSSVQRQKEYGKQLEIARDEHIKANKNRNEAVALYQKKNDMKIQADSFVDVKNRNKDPITLTDICTAPAPRGVSQYMGYADGVKKYENFQNENKTDQERNKQRWDTGREVLASLVKKPKAPFPFISFLSNHEGKRKMKENDTRIGGNDFW